MNPFPIICAEIKKSKKGTITIILLIAMSVSLGVGISTQERAFREGANKGAEPFDIIIGAPGNHTNLLLGTVYLQPISTNLIAGKILEELQQDEEIIYAAPLGFGDSYNGYPIVGTTANLITESNKAPFTEGEPFRQIHEAVIGIDVKLNVGEIFTPTHGRVSIEEMHNDHNIPYKVTGRLPRWYSPWDKAILVPIESVWQIHHLIEEHTEESIGPPWKTTPPIPAISVKTKTINHAYRIRNKYRQNKETTAFFPAEVLLELYAIMGDGGAILSIIAFFTQVLVLGAVMLSIFASLEGRKRGLAILRALGASGTYLFLSLWLYTVGIIIIGTLLGLAGGGALALIISENIKDQTGLVLTPYIGIKELKMAGVLILSAFLLALLPGISIYRQPISGLLKK